MDFTLDKKHEMARGLFRDFAETEVKPLAQETDETEQFPAETVAKMAKYGFMGIPVPKEYGGQGCDPLTYVSLQYIFSQTFYRNLGKCLFCSQRFFHQDVLLGHCQKGYTL